MSVVFIRIAALVVCASKIADRLTDRVLNATPGGRDYSEWNDRGWIFVVSPSLPFFLPVVNPPPARLPAPS
jgi:hypothetical protein